MHTYLKALNPHTLLCLILCIYSESSSQLRKLAQTKRNQTVGSTVSVKHSHAPTKKTLVDLQGKNTVSVSVFG